MAKVTGDKRLIFSKRLRSLRLTNHLTLTQLSQSLDIPCSTLSCWERGTAFPRNPVEIDIIAYFFGVKRDYLF